MLFLCSQFLKKSLQFANFFTARCLDVRFWDLLYFICLKFNPQYWYLLLYSRKTCWFRSYFLQGKGRNFCGIFIKSQKLCLHKIFNIGLAMKVNCHEFLLFYAQCKMHITPVSLKNYSFFTIFWTDRVCFFSTKKLTSKHVYVMFMFTHGAYVNGTSKVFAYLLIILLERDWFGFFFNKWRCIRFTP